MKEESLVGGAEQDIDSTLSVSGLGLQSTDITPTSTCSDSGMATSNSVSYNDLVVTSALVDCPPADETHSNNDFEPGSLVTPNTSRMDTKKCKFQDIGGWFHLAFEDDTPFKSQIQDSYRATDRVCESLPETCVSGANITGRNLSAEFDSETEQVTAVIMNSLNTSNTECSDKTQNLVSAEPAKENADVRVLDVSSSLDESWSVGLSMEQEVDKIDLSSFEVEQDISAVGSEANKSSGLNLRSVCSAGGFDNTSSETVSSSCQSLPSVALPKQMLSNALSCDVSDSQHISKCEGTTGFVTKVEQQERLPEQGEKRDEILCTPLSCRGILRRERTTTCINSSAVESKASALNLRRGMTKCGSDIFPKYFLEGLHCTFGEVILYNRSEEEKLTGKHRGVTQTKSSPTIRGQLETPRHAVVRPPGNLSKGHQFNGFYRPVAPCTVNSGHRVRPARPPSYAEAMAAKAGQNGSGSGQNVAGFTSHSLVMESHPLPSTVCTDRNEEGCVPALPSDKSIIGYACDATVPVSTVTVVTCSMISHALQSIPSVTRIGTSTTIQSIASISSKPISAVSTNSKTVVSCKQTETTGQYGECDSKLLSIQNPDMPNELLCDLDISTHEPSIGSAFVSSDYSTCSAKCLSQTNSNVTNEENRLQIAVCASMVKQRLDQKFRIRKRRQRSTDPKLRSSRAFGRAIGRSKSDSSEILEKKRQEYNSDEDKENVLVPSNSFLKRKLAAMKLASKEEELRNASHCNKCIVPYHLSMVCEENSAYADDAERESAYSPRDMKKKKSLLFDCRDWQSEETTVHSTSLNGLELSDRLQQETKVFHQDEFCEVRIKKLPLYSKTSFVSQPKSFRENYCPSESFNSALRTSCEQNDSSVLKSSSASTPSSDRNPYLFRSAKLPVPDAIKIKWSVSELKQMYKDRTVSQSDSVAYPSRMIALHDSPYFV